jgi:hypothetical protein
MTADLKDWRFRKEEVHTIKPSARGNQKIMRRIAEDYERIATMVEQ